MGDHIVPCPRSAELILRRWNAGEYANDDDVFAAGDSTRASEKNCLALPDIACTLEGAGLPASSNIGHRNQAAGVLAWQKDRIMNTASKRLRSEGLSRKDVSLLVAAATIATSW